MFIREFVLEVESLLGKSSILGSHLFHQITQLGDFALLKTKALLIAFLIFEIRELLQLKTAEFANEIDVVVLIDFRLFEDSIDDI